MKRKNSAIIDNDMTNMRKNITNKKAVKLAAKALGKLMSPIGRRNNKNMDVSSNNFNSPVDKFVDTNKKNKNDDNIIYENERVYINHNLKDNYEEYYSNKKNKTDYNIDESGYRDDDYSDITSYASCNFKIKVIF